MIDGKPTWILAFTESEKNPSSNEAPYRIGKKKRKQKTIKGKTRGVYLFEW
jgi:hypothetical protein